MSLLIRLYFKVETERERTCQTRTSAPDMSSGHCLGNEPVTAGRQSEDYIYTTKSKRNGRTNITTDKHVRTFYKRNI